jgi:hypothetical protein
MSAGAATVLSGAIEGDLDEVVLRKIVEHAGCRIGTVYGREGKPRLLQNLVGYNNAAKGSPWVVLIDLDKDCDCAPTCLQQWLPRPSRYMCFRIVVRMIEAWLLADRERIAHWLGVAEANFPEDPDSLENPKQVLINLARRSRRRIKTDLVPRDGSGRSVGPLYNATMTKFIDDQDAGWRPEHALRRSDSLARCINHLQQLA